MSEPYRKPGEPAAVPRETRRWFTKSGDVVKGPFELVALRRSLKEGYIKRTTLVRPEDETEWRPISEATDVVRGVAPRPKSAPVALAPVAPVDDGAKLLIYGALSCGLAYVGLVFGIIGLVASRRALREGNAKYARAGHVLSIVGVAVQVALFVFAAVVISLHL